MKKILIALFVLIGMNLNAQLLYKVSFENGINPDTPKPDWYEESSNGYWSVVNNPSGLGMVGKATVGTGYSRAEICSQRLPIVEKTYYYSFKIFFPTGWATSVNLNWILFNQYSTWPCEQDNDKYKPYICGNGGVFNDLRLKENDINYAVQDKNIFQYRSRAEPDCQLLSFPRKEGEWMYITVESYWTKTLNGFHKIWVNGELVQETSGIKTLIDNFQPGLCDMYFVTGVYKDGNTSVSVYFDDITIYDAAGSTLEDACPLCVTEPPIPPVPVDPCLDGNKLWKITETTKVVYEVKAGNRKESKAKYKDCEVKSTTTTVSSSIIR